MLWTYQVPNLVICTLKCFHQRHCCIDSAWVDVHTNREADKLLITIETIEGYSAPCSLKLLVQFAQPVPATWKQDSCVVRAETPDLEPRTNLNNVNAQASTLSIHLKSLA